MLVRVAGAGAQQGRRRALRPEFPSGARIQLLESGLTVGPEPDPDEVYAWDDVGTALLRFEPTTPALRPLLGTAGGRDGPQGEGTRHLISTTPLTLVKPFSFWVTFRIDTWVSNRRIIDFETFNYLACATTPGTFRWEQGSSDMSTVTPIVDGGLCQVLVQVAASGGTSRILLNKVEEFSIAGTVTVPTARTVGILARNDAANPSLATILGAGVWQHADNAAMVAWDKDLIHAYGDWLMGG